MTALIEAWDPMGFSGAPADEYSLEVSHLLTLLRGCENPGDVAKCTQQVLLQWFGPSVRTPGLEAFAAGVWVAWTNLPEGPVTEAESG